jgi:hypothetical protein
MEWWAVEWTSRARGVALADRPTTDPGIRSLLQWQCGYMRGACRMSHVHHVCPPAKLCLRDKARSTGRYAQLSNRRLPVFLRFDCGLRTAMQEHGEGEHSREHASHSTSC